MGGKKRKYQINENYFSNIDTEDKAYFLGFLYADGCITNDSGIHIQLNYKDINILEKLKYCINFNGPIKILEPRIGGTIDGRTICGNKSCLLRFYSKNITNDLYRYGCFPNKGFKIRWPNNLQDNLINHFLRGYSDGDGWIYYSKSHKSGSYGLAGNFEFCQDVKNIILDILSINCHISSKKNNKIHQLSIGGNRQFIKFCNWLYKDSNIYLQRKYDKYIDIKNIINSNLKNKYLFT